MHCKLRCDRNRKLRAHCNRDAADTSQVAARTSSQHEHTLYVQSRSLRIAAASQVAWRPSSQFACMSQRQNRCCTASGNAIFFTAIASAGLTIHRRLRIDRHRNLRAQCKIGVPMPQVAVRVLSQHDRTRCVFACTSRLLVKMPTCILLSRLIHDFKKTLPFVVTNP